MDEQLGFEFEAENDDKAIGMATMLVTFYDVVTDSEPPEMAEED